MVYMRYWTIVPGMGLTLLPWINVSVFVHTCSINSCPFYKDQSCVYMYVVLVIYMSTHFAVILSLYLELP